MDKKKSVKETETICFTKGELISSEHYREKKDLIDALLDETETYQLKDVDQLIQKFLKGKVN